jgi:hypothetical protein
MRDSSSRFLRKGSSRSSSQVRVLGVFLVVFAAGALPLAAQKTRPTLEVSSPNHSYPTSLASIRQLDLNNSEVVIFDDKGEPELKAHLRGGKYEIHYRVGSDWLRHNWLKVLNGDSGETETAVAEFDWVATGASASDYGVVQLFQLDDGHLKVVQQILFNTRGSKKVGAFFNPKSNVLVVRGVHGWEHCCPTRLDVVTFRFDGSAFKQVAYHMAPLQ